MFVYLDNSSTTKPYKEVVSEMVEHLENNYGNPSSLHRMGINAEKSLKSSRRKIASSMGVKEEEIYFTAGGTEADNIAIFGAAYAKKRQGNKVITSVIEHPAVLECFKKLEAEGFLVKYIDVDKNGIIDLASLEKEIDENTILISIMHVNNEIGSIQPIKEIVKIKEKVEKKTNKNIIFHSDKVQSYGKIPFDADGLDLISVSGHKIHGPKGIGALYIKKGIVLSPNIFGGGQEKGVRPGTENIPAIAGFGKAAELTNLNIDDKIIKLKGLKEHLLNRIKSEIENVKINSPQDSVCSILNISFIGVRGEVLLHTLEQSDIYVSTGSACSSNKKGQSHVLKSISLSNAEIEGAIRFSFSEFNTISEIDYVMEKLKEAIEKFRKLGSFR